MTTREAVPPSDRQLTGIYLHGSLAMGSYYRPKSDLDLLVACSEALGAAERERVARLLLKVDEQLYTPDDHLTVQLIAIGRHQTIPA